MQKELIYAFVIGLYNDSDRLIKSIRCDHWEFPTDEEIQAAIEDNGADYAKVERIYFVDEIPFT